MAVTPADGVDVIVLEQEIIIAENSAVEAGEVGQGEEAVAEGLVTEADRGTHNIHEVIGAVGVHGRGFTT